MNIFHYFHPNLEGLILMNLAIIIHLSAWHVKEMQNYKFERK
jgi:hypothetical protein